MDTEYRKTEMSLKKKREARDYYERNLARKVLDEGGKDIYYENHIDWIEWGLYQEYDKIYHMSIEDAAKYIVEWLDTRDKTFYSTPRYIERLNSLL